MKLISSEREKKSLKVSFLYGEKNLWCFLCAINLVLESGGNIIFCGGSLTTTAKNMRDEKIVFNFSNLHLTRHRRSMSFHWKNSGCTQCARWVGSSAIFSWALFFVSFFSSNDDLLIQLRKVSQPAEWRRVFQRNIKAYKKAEWIRVSTSFIDFVCIVSLCVVLCICFGTGGDFALTRRVKSGAVLTSNALRLAFVQECTCYISQLRWVEYFFLRVSSSPFTLHTVCFHSNLCASQKRRKKQTACNIKKSIRRNM